MNSVLLAKIDPVSVVAVIVQAYKQWTNDRGSICFSMLPLLVLVLTCLALSTAKQKCPKNNNLQKNIPGGPISVQSNGGWVIGGWGYATRYNTANFGPFNWGSGNVGWGNFGDDNQGNGNFGSGNQGDGNSGSWNVGVGNCGNYNVGRFNQGNWNVGVGNGGNGYQLGWCNQAGQGNTGQSNSGTQNVGYLNTGSNNIGISNTGSSKP